MGIAAGACAAGGIEGPAALTGICATGLCQTMCLPGLGSVNLKPVQASAHVLGLCVSCSMSQQGDSLLDSEAADTVSCGLQSQALTRVFK